MRHLTKYEWLEIGEAMDKGRGNGGLSHRGLCFAEELINSEAYGSYDCPTFKILGEKMGYYENSYWEGDSLGRPDFYPDRVLFCCLMVAVIETGDYDDLFREVK